MKKKYDLLKGLIAVMLVAVQFAAHAQVTISTQVFPPFRAHLTDYSSHPEQMLITIMNTGTKTLRIQLRGNVTGDNGVELRVSSTYKSKTPITLAAGGIRVINAGDLPYFFDFTKFVYTGYTQSDFFRVGGLPEGNYRLCLQAFDYDTNAVLSGSDPTGCSNVFTVTNVDPPVITAPYDGQQIIALAANIFTINWTTPAGAPPSTMYNIRIVEVLGNKNINDAVMSAQPPYLFDKQVMGNTYVYSPADPALTEGRQYAMMITAIDPNNTVTFKNKGNSTIVGFTYKAPMKLLNAPVITSALDMASIPSQITFTTDGTPIHKTLKLRIVSVDDGQTPADALPSVNSAFVFEKQIVFDQITPYQDKQYYPNLVIDGHPAMFYDIALPPSYRVSYMYREGDGFHTIYLTAIGFPAAKQGAKFAAVVQEIDPDNPVAIINNGMSSIITFRNGDPLSIVPTMSFPADASTITTSGIQQSSAGFYMKMADPKWPYAGMVYNLKVAEVPDGLTPEIAMKNATSYVFSAPINNSTGTYQTFFKYNLLTSGKKYALQVQVADTRNQYVMANNGYGPVTSFTYQNVQPVAITTTADLTNVTMFKDFHDNPQKFKVTITNNQNTTLYYATTLRIYKDGSQISQGTAANTAVLPAGQSYTYTGSDFFGSQSDLVSGAYQAVVELYPQKDAGQKYGTGVSATNTTTLAFATSYNIPYTAVPLLSSPTGDITLTPGDSMPITWATPDGVSAATKFRLKIRQDKILLDTTIAGNTYQYAQSKGLLKSGVNTTINVQAIDPNNTFAFTHDGLDVNLKWVQLAGAPDGLAYHVQLLQGKNVIRDTITRLKNFLIRQNAGTLVKGTQYTVKLWGVDAADTAAIDWAGMATKTFVYTQAAYPAGYTNVNGTVRLNSGAPLANTSIAINATIYTFTYASDRDRFNGFSEDMLNRTEADREYYMGFRLSTMAVGTAVTDGQGHFSIKSPDLATLNGKFARVYMKPVSNSDVISLRDTTVELVAGANNSMGVLRAYKFGEQYNSTLTGTVKFAFRQTEVSATGGDYNLPGTVSYPLANTRFKLRMFTKKFTQPAVWDWYVNHRSEDDVTRSNQERLSTTDEEIGEVTTDDKGNFTTTIYNKANFDKVNYITLDDWPGVFYYKVYLVSTDGRFILPVAQTTLQAADNVSVGTLTALANTYRFTPTIADGKGTSNADGQIALYRKSDFYTTNANLQAEGNLSVKATADTVINGDKYRKIGITTPGKSLNGLFYNTNTGDEYKVVISGARYIANTVTMSYAGKGTTAPTQPDNYAATYTMSYTQPTFAGHVTKFINNVKYPAANAVVRVALPGGTLGSNTDILVSTDESGYFKATLPADSIGFYSSNSPAHPYSIRLADDTDPLGSFRDTLVISQPGQQRIKDASIFIPTFTVSGKVFDQKNQPLAGVMVLSKTLGRSVVTKFDGTFTLGSQNGADTLILSKTSCSTNRLGININGANLTLPNITLSRLSYPVNITVTDNNNAAIAGAVISISNATGGNYTTNAQGIVAANTYDSNPEIDIAGPAGSNYVNAQAGPQLDANAVTSLKIKLDHGVVISGKVMADANTVAGAQVVVDGLEYIKVVTDNAGKYSINIPKGNNLLKASKPGFVTDNKPGNYAADQSLDFSLTTAPASLKTLLGYPIQIDAIADNGGNKIISGSFVNVPGNSTFSVKAGTGIKFHNIEVGVVNGIYAPIKGDVQTDETSVPVKAFGYLPLNLTNGGSQVVISSVNNGQSGVIKGDLKVDYASFIPADAGTIINSDAQHFVLASQGGTGQVPVFSTAADAANSTTLYLKATTTAQQLTLAGFKVAVDMPNSTITANGIHYIGTMSLATVKGMGNSSLALDDIQVDTTGHVSNVVAAYNASFDIFNWKANVSSVAYNDNGFTFGGNLKVFLPSSQAFTQSIAFTDMVITPDQIFGGNLQMPDDGIDVVGAASFKPGSTPFSFGLTSDGSAYYLTGSGSLSVAKLFDDFKINEFTIQTDGKFYADIPLDYKKDFVGLGKMHVTGIKVNTINTPRVDILGEFELSAIPNFKATVGNVHFGQGKTVSVDELGIEMDLASIGKTELKVKYVDNADTTGFEGSGKFGITTLGSSDVGFKYYKTAQGLTVGGNFMAATRIPLGLTGYFITSVGGGFTLGPHSDWTVTISGIIQAGLNASLSKTTVNLTVAPGPVITGTSETIIKQMATIDGNIVLDIPNKKLNIDVTGKMDLVPGLASTAEGWIVISVDPNDAYFFLGAQVDMNTMGGILSNKGEFYAGVNVDITKHKSDLKQYFDKMNQNDPVFANNIFNGFSGRVSSTTSKDFSYDFYIASISAHLNYSNYGSVYGNIGASQYGFNLGTKWDIGGSASVGYDIFSATLSVGVDFGANLTGTYNSATNHLSLAAKGNAGFHANYNSSGCYNGIGVDWDCCCWGIVCWPSGLTVGICANASMEVDVDSSSGVSVKI